MLKMLRKECKLAMHPTNWIFLFLSSMLLIPAYPYYVIFFYTGLGLFFTCLTGREMRDIEYTALLPIQKSELVKGRFAFAVMVEILQFLLAIPFVILKQTVMVIPNPVGMDANLAFLGLSLLVMGVFNLTFFGAYYRAPEKVGKAFVKASVALILVIGVLETCAHVLPLFKNCLDTPDPQYLACKIVVLVLGVLGFAGMTYLSALRSIRRFESLDL